MESQQQQAPIILLDPQEMEYYLNNNTLKKVPVCISSSALYKMSATGQNNNNAKKQFIAFNSNDLQWSNYKPKKQQSVDEDASSSSSSSSSSSCLESTCSSRSDSPEPKKKRHHKLMREIRRLRGENAFLRSSVTMLKNDLRDVTLSRQNADVIHRRTYEEFEQRHDKLEQELLMDQDEIRELKEQIEQLQLASPTPPSPPKNTYTPSPQPYVNNMYACFELPQEDLDCQPQAYESALPEVEIKMDHLVTEEDQVADYFTRRRLDDSDQEEELEEETEPEEPFEQVATSYMHQALISKLSSARVRLELDDLILKHEPSTDAVLTVLANSFLHWVSQMLTKKESTTKQLYNTKIQQGVIEFWENILQSYIVEEENQLSFLDDLEQTLATEKTKDIVDHFDRLLVILYKVNVIDDCSIILWWQENMNLSVSSHLRQVSRSFYDWCKADDSEDDDSEDEDDDDASVHEEEEEEEGDGLIFAPEEPCHCQFDNDTCICPPLQTETDQQKKKKSVRINDCK